VELINPAPAVARRAAWLLEQHNIAAPAGHKPEYSFVTFADDAYLARITDKAMMLAEEE
jgi:glutamate racemase